MVLITLFTHVPQPNVTCCRPPEVTEEYLKEGKLRRTIGLFDGEKAKGIHTSRFGIIPKPHKPGKWRLILDWSHPSGAAVNDGISKELSSLSYGSVDDIVDTILSLGQGALLAKIDIRSACRVVPVHPDDRMLLGMVWHYLDDFIVLGPPGTPMCQEHLDPIVSDLQ